MNDFINYFGVVTIVCLLWVLAVILYGLGLWCCGWIFNLLNKE